MPTSITFAILASLVCSILCFKSTNTAYGEEPQLPVTKRCGRGLVTSVPSGDSLILKNGDTLKLAAIKAPEVWQKNGFYKSWPYAHTSQNALKALLLNQQVSLHCFTTKLDHQNQKMAHVIRAHDGLWIQKILLQEGNAMLYGGAADTVTQHQLFTAEARAIAANKGLWKNGTYSLIKASDDDAFKTGWFQRVIGTIKTVTHVKDRYYLNFGDDWRTDFTVQLSTKLAKKYQMDNIPIPTLNGTEVEVRGFVEWAGGYKIILTGPHQLFISDQQAN